MAVGGHALPPMVTSFLSHELNKLGMAGIKLELIVDVHPFHFLGIITSFQRKMIHYLTCIVVVVHSLSFHPRIICVSGIIHVTL